MDRVGDLLPNVLPGLRESFGSREFGLSLGNLLFECLQLSDECICAPVAIQHLGDQGHGSRVPRLRHPYLLPALFNVRQSILSRAITVDDDLPDLRFKLP
jgi:hypothetical protein